MSNQMATMQGCCCGSPLLCNQKTPGVGAVSLQRYGVIHDLPTPPPGADARERRFGWTIRCILSFVSTHAGDFYLVWSKNQTPTRTMAPFGTTYYFAHDQNEVFTPSQLAIFRRPDAFSPFTVVTAGSPVATLINQALGVANIHGASVIVSPVNELPQWPFPSVPEDSLYVKLDGYGVPGSGVSWFDKPSQLNQYWMNQRHVDLPMTSVAANLHAGFMLLPSGTGAFDLLIYAMGCEPATGSAIPGAEGDILRLGLCAPYENNSNHGTIGVAISGVGYTGMPSQATFDAATIGWKRSLFIDLIADINNSYQTLHHWQGMNFYGVGDEWGVTMSPLGVSTGDRKNLLLQYNPLIPSFRSRLGFYVTFFSRLSLGGSPTNAGSLYGRIIYQSPGTYTADEAAPLVDGCELMEYQITGTTFRGLKVIDAQAAMASLIGVATEKIVNEPTLSTGVGNVTIKLNNASATLF